MKTKFRQAIEDFYAVFLETHTFTDDTLQHYEAVLIEFNKQMFDAIIQREFVMAIARGAIIREHDSTGPIAILKGSILPTQTELCICNWPEGYTPKPKFTYGFSIAQPTPPTNEREKTEAKIYELIGVYTGPNSINTHNMPTLSMLIAKRNELEKIEVMGEFNEVQPAS